MPLFFFHVRHQDTLDQDFEGLTFDSLEEAAASASCNLREIVAEDLRAAQQIDIIGIEVTDASGNMLAMVTVEDAVLDPLNGPRGD